MRAETWPEPHALTEIRDVTPNIAYPPHPAHVAPYVEVLGPAKAVAFLVEFGGVRMYFPKNPQGRSDAEKMIGAEALHQLNKRLTDDYSRIPRPNTWLIHALKAEGLTVTEIVRRLRLTEVSVRKALKAPPNGAAPPTDEAPPKPGDQLSLF